MIKEKNEDSWLSYGSSPREILEYRASCMGMDVKGIMHVIFVHTCTIIASLVLYLLQVQDSSPRIYLPTEGVCFCGN